jgi:hypothetical protein
MTLKSEISLPFDGFQTQDDQVCSISITGEKKKIDWLHLIRLTTVLAIRSDTVKSLGNCVRLCFLNWKAQRNETVSNSSNPFILEIEELVFLVEYVFREDNDIFGERVISRNLCPPRSPDLTRPDFYLWGAAQSSVYCDRPRTLNELKTAVTAYIRNIS